MLVLSRKLQEQIVIPGLNIRVTVLSVGTNRVMLGIEAPNGVSVRRVETLVRAETGGAASAPFAVTRS